MAEHVWSVLCERMLIDFDTHVVNLIGITERFIINETLESLELALADSVFPVPLRLITWCVRSSAAEKGFDLRISWNSPDGKKPQSKTVRVAFKDDSRGVRVRTAVEGIPWRGPGDYWLTVEKKDDGKRWTTVARLPVQIEMQEPD